MSNAQHYLNDAMQSLVAASVFAAPGFGKEEIIAAHTAAVTALRVVAEAERQHRENLR